MARKIISIVLSVGLLFQQGGLVYAAGEINLANYLSQARNAIVQPDVFQPARLRYISYDITNNDFKLLLDKGNAKLNDATPELFNYFLIGLALPNDTFWVNLRPDAPENIIDPILEKTDIGKIFLEADLQLKKDTASLTSPQNPEGKAYWDKLYKKAGELFGTENITIPTITRPWIVPNEVIVRETEDSAYIYKATLKVMLEEDYLRGMKDDPAVGGASGRGTINYSFNDPRLKELNEYSTQLIRETIIPKLTKEINSSKRYAQLRQVYYSLVLSRWFKQKYQGLPVGNGFKPFPTLDSGDLTNLTSQEPCDKQAYFQAYQKSFKDGEYNLKETVATPYGQSVRSYISGGINVVGDPIMPGKISVSNSSPVVNDAITNNSPEQPAATTVLLRTSLYGFLSALESQSESNNTYNEEAKNAISRLINTIEQQIKLIDKKMYRHETTIKIGKTMIEREWEYLCDQMPEIKNLLFPKYNDVIKALALYSKVVGSPLEAKELKKYMDEIRSYLKNANKGIIYVFSNVDEKIVDKLSGIVGPIDKNIVSITKGELSGDKLLSYVSGLKNGLNEIVTRNLPLRLNRVANEGKETMAKKVSEDIVAAADKVEELYNKLIKRMFVALIGKINSALQKGEVKVQYLGAVDTINNANNLAELCEIVPGIVVQLNSFIENAVEKGAKDELLKIKGEMDSLIEELQASTASPLEGSVPSVRTIPLSPDVQAKLDDLKDYFYDKLNELFGEEEKPMKPFVAIIKESQSFGELFIAVKYIKDKIVKEVIPGSKQLARVKEIIRDSDTKVKPIAEYLKQKVDAYKNEYYIGNKQISPLSTGKKYDNKEFLQFIEEFYALKAVTVFMGAVKSVPTVGSPLIGIRLSPDLPDNWRLVRFGDLSEAVKQILKARTQDVFPEVRIPEIADNDAFVVELNDNGEINIVLGAWIKGMMNGIYIRNDLDLSSRNNKIISDTLNDLMAGRKSVGSPVVGEELKVFSEKGNVIKYLRFVSYDKDIKGKNNAVMLKDIMDKLNRTAFPSGDGRTVHYSTLDSSNLSGMYFAVELDGSGKVVDLKGILRIVNGKRDTLGGKNPEVIKALKNKEKEIVSSAVVSKEDVSENKRGGIDLTDRALHIKLERVGSFASTPLLLPQVKNAQGLDLDKEFEQVEALASSGIVPNSHRLLELFTVCHYRGEFGERLNQIISCLKAASAIQEAQAIDSDEDFLLALMMPEMLS